SPNRHQYTQHDQQEKQQRDADIISIHRYPFPINPTIPVRATDCRVATRHLAQHPPNTVASTTLPPCPTSRAFPNSGATASISPNLYFLIKNIGAAALSI